MKADYFNNPLVPMSYSGMSGKWYEVARSREKRLFKKVDVFMYLSVNKDNTFEMLYVYVDAVNRRFAKSYHGKIVLEHGKYYLIIKKGLWRKKYLVVASDERFGLVTLTNTSKSKCWIVSKCLPYDRAAFENILDVAEKTGVDVNNIELFYEPMF